MQKLLFNDRDRFRAQALFLGKNINLQNLENYVCLATMPVIVSVGEHGCAVLLNYGAVVLFNLESVEKVAFLTKLSSQVSGSFANPETEEVEIHLNLAESERVKEGKISLHEFSVERLQIVADILAKSVVLSHYETSLAGVFDQIEPFAASLQREDRSRRQSRELLRQLGTTLLVQHKIVGQVEIIDKPELLWESPQLENLYLRLEDEYEIRERHHALERKLDLISQTAQTVLEFMQHSSSQRVEWYVVILIVVEILLSLYDIIFKG
ncbi:MAG TPA: RMD1 family protein [Nostoc sp.]|uniref:RMD1 family protein n=1 Tax=Nostoc sp. TaxID=1180 RepID=UPI002D40D7CA|nr:RMD1 family protein [Nostoc sp.]HYX13124.1 RMD1 family protein [Nostoc sp.]